jgi:hypothetical protein
MGVEGMNERPPRNCSLQNKRHRLPCLDRDHKDKDKCKEGGGTSEFYTTTGVGERDSGLWGKARVGVVEPLRVCGSS